VLGDFEQTCNDRKKDGNLPVFWQQFTCMTANHNRHYDSLGPIIDGRQLRIGVIVSQFSVKGGKMRIIGSGRVVVAGLPQTKMD